MAGEPFTPVEKRVSLAHGSRFMARKGMALAVRDAQYLSWSANVHPVIGLAIALCLILGGPARAADKAGAETTATPARKPAAAPVAVPPLSPAPGKPANKPAKGADQPKRCDRLKGAAQDHCLEEVRAGIMEVDRKNRAADAARASPGGKSATKSSEAPQKPKADSAKSPASGGSNEQVGDQRTQRESPKATREKNK